MPATLSLPLLENARIASPCDARWEDMTGDDKVRRCGQCDLNVHNLSAMTAPEAQALLSDYFHADGTPKQGRFCARLYKRPDGTVLTQDCPVGLARIRAVARAAAVRMAAAVGLISLAGWATARAARSDSSLINYEPFASLVRTLNYAGITRPVPPVTRLMGDVAMGKIAMPLPAPRNPQPNGQ